MPSPMLRESTFQRPTLRDQVHGSGAMTIGGTASATIVLLVVLLMAGVDRLVAGGSGAGR